jgi:VanZ family protein
MSGKKIPHSGIFSIPNFDKFVHASLFGMQVLLACFPFFRSNSASARLFFKITIGVVLYGIAMEFVQKYFTTDRAFDFWDMLADAVGAFTGYLCMSFWYKRILRKQQAIV